MNIRLFGLVCISLIKDGAEWVGNHLPFRGKLCWLLGHRYPVKWERVSDDAEVGRADIATGCVFCANFCNRCCHSIPKGTLKAHLSEGCEPFEKSFGEILDSNTVVCQHGCGETIRVTDEHAHEVYGCDISTEIGRGPVEIAV